MLYLKYGTVFLSPMHYSRKLKLFKTALKLLRFYEKYGFKLSKQQINQRFFLKEDILVQMKI